MAISFGGLSSKIDTESIITQLVGIERLPIDQMATQKTQIASARDSLSSFLSKLSALRTAADKLATPTDFKAFKAKSSDSAIVATVTGSASAGAFDVDVKVLAREQRNHSAQFLSATTGLGQAGSIQIQVGAAAAANVTVDANDSLSAVATKINASGARVSASVLYDGSKYRLVVRGLDSGAANAFTITDPSSALGLGTPASTIKTALDSEIEIDGVTIKRPTNQIVGVIPGVTLALTRETGADPARVSVDSDPSEVKANIDAFVSAYNGAMSAARLTAGFGSIKAANALLSGDGTIRDAVTRVGRALGSPVAGATGLYRSLSSVGLTSERDGSLKFSASKFDAALLADPSSVEKLFVGVNGAKGAMGTLSAALTALTTGEKAGLNARVAAFEKDITRLDERAVRLESQASAMEESLRKRFTAMEQAVARYKSMGSALGSLTGSTSGELPPQRPAPDRPHP